jgi:hypothetical protein
MKPRNLLLMIAVTAVGTTGCYTRKEIIHEPAGATVTTTKEVVVVDTPPAAQVETIGVAPSPDHVWMPGHWTRDGNRWVWMSGRWEVRPNPASIYVPGHWEKRGDGYIWREGYWR